VVGAIVAGGSQAKAAAVASVSEKTVWRWLQLPHVQAAIEQQQRAIVEAAARASLAHVKAAMGVLARIMTDQTVPPNTQVQAAGKLLDAAERWLNLTTLDTRLKRLEDKLL
jgi:hypothetical protein